MRPLFLARLLATLAFLGACRVAPAVHDESRARRAEELEAALELAGPNRGEIERALAHFGGTDEPEELAALEYLVAHMPGHGFIAYALRDAEGRAGPFAHRGSNEPFEDWRGLLAERVEAALDDLPAEATTKDVAARAGALAAELVGFSDLYYLHPTDPSCSEMLAARRGRCEDITNMTTYAMRLAGVASAADYTPWWGQRDNNHAWPVVLDAAGRGSSGDGARAAKVHRKAYARQRENG